MTKLYKVLANWAKYNREKYKHYNRKPIIIGKLEHISKDDFNTNEIKSNDNIFKDSNKTNIINISKFNTDNVKYITEQFPELKCRILNMKKKEIETKYQEMLDGIKSSTIYDGRGTYDVYKCDKCGKEVLTTYADKGVTPFCIPCECGSNMNHIYTYKTQPKGIEPKRFYRPPVKEMYNMNDSQLDHIFNEGLILEE